MFVSCLTSSGSVSLNSHCSPVHDMQCCEDYPEKKIFWFSEISKHLRPSLTRAQARIAKVELGRLVPSWVPRVGPELDISSIVIFVIIEEKYYQVLGVKLGDYESLIRS